MSFKAAVAAQKLLFQQKLTIDLFPVFGCIFFTYAITLDLNLVLVDVYVKYANTNKQNFRTKQKKNYGNLICQQLPEFNLIHFGMFFLFYFKQIQQKKLNKHIALKAMMLFMYYLINDAKKTYICAGKKSYSFPYCYVDYCDLIIDIPEVIFK